jgi:hypothetical protein
MRSYTLATKWLIIRYDSRENLRFVEVRDNVGRCRRTVVTTDGLQALVYSPWWIKKLTGKDTEVRMSAPEKVVEMIHQAILPYTLQQGPHPRTLPVFLQDVPEEKFNQLRETLFAMGVDRELWDLTRPLVLSHSQWKTRARPGLPVNILAIGDTLQAFSRLQGYDWFTNPVVQQHGLVLTGAGDKKEILEKLKKGHRHIVVVAALDWPDALGVLPGLRPAAHPRVLISLDNLEPWPAKKVTGLIDTLPGTALVWHRRSDDQPADEFLEYFMKGIVHDLAFHDAMPRGALIFGHPAANQGLRISDAFQVELERNLEKPFVSMVADKDKTRGMPLPPPPPVEEASVFDIKPPSPPVKDAVEKYKSLLEDIQLGDVRFRHEHTGLLPLSFFRSEMSEVEPDVKAYKKKYSKDPVIRRLIRSSQDRSVDIAVQRDARTVFEGLTPGVALNSLSVPPGTVLAAGAKYIVLLRIGRPLPFSTLTKKPPGIDPLLPEKEGGHVLDVVLFAQDFTILGKRLRPLHLPPVGPSKTVKFPVVAPKRPGTAQLRISVYYKDYMIQSFLLQAVVEEKERFEEGEMFLKTELVYSRTERFGDLDERKKRKVAVAVNQDSGRATHSFMVKQGNITKEVSLPEDMIGDQIAKFRDILDRAMRQEHKHGVFSKNPRAPEFDEVVRDLARQGAALRGELFDRYPGLKDVLKMLRESKGEVLQFVRLDPNYAFPWSVVYDYRLPITAAAVPPPVCRGEKDGQPCGHTYKDRVYCINGFWGVRHRVEQMMGYDLGIVPKLPPLDNAGVLVVRGYKDKFTRQLADDLQNELGNRVVTVFPGDFPLLDSLWDRDKGPAALVLVGHMETRTVTGEPDVPRIVVEAGKQWLHALEVRERTEDDDILQKPQPLVLLMACSSAAVELRTLNDLFKSLVRAGAAGVVGNETVINTKLASTFAGELTGRLWKGESFGESIRLVRRRMLAQGNPLGFILTAFGDADLQFT